MNEFDEKTQTIEFEAIKDEPQTEKPQQNRRGNDEFTTARNGRGYEVYNRKEKSNGALIGIASALTVLLVVAIVAGIFILKGDKERQLQNEGLIVDQKEPEKENLPEEEEVPEIQNLTITCNMVMYGENISKSGGVYTIKADLYDQEMYMFDSKAIVIDDDTDIRQDGKRLTAQALVYIIENSGGDNIVFKGEIREKDGRALSISFETPQEVPEEEPEEQTPEAEAPEEAPGEENPEVTAPEEETPSAEQAPQTPAETTVPAQ